MPNTSQMSMRIQKISWSDISVAPLLCARAYTVDLFLTLEQCPHGGTKPVWFRPVETGKPLTYTS
jgi:hypothetical protein